MSEAGRQACRALAVLLWVFVTALPIAWAGAGISAASWRSIGPSHFPGRISTIAIHPTQTQKIWVGSTGGGIWRSTDGGATWATSGDFLPSLSITSIVMSPGNPAVMYAGTGEFSASLGYPDGRRSTVGAGILKSTDGGITWSPLPATNPAADIGWRHVVRLAVHSTDASILLARTESSTGVARIYRTADGGLTWSVARSEISKLAGDVQFDRVDVNRAVAVIGTGASYTTDAGQTWTQPGGMGGGAVIAYSSQSRLLFASVAGDHHCCSHDDDARLTRSADGGLSWSRVTGSDSMNYLGSNGPRQNAIWVDPTNSDHIIVGGRYLVRTKDGGATWLRISDGQPGSVPTGQNVIVASPGYNGTSNRTIYIGTDGGLYRATDIEAVTAPHIGWTALNNGLATTDFFSGAGHTGLNGRIAGGTRTGTLVYAGTSWSALGPGDGSGVAVDPTNGNRIFVAVGGLGQSSKVYRSTTGSAPVSEITAGSLGFAHATVPMLFDPYNPDIVLVGATQLVRATNARTEAPFWREIGNFTPPYLVDARITAIAVARGNPDVIWFGSGQLPLQRTLNGTAERPAWTEAGPLKGPTALLVDSANNLVVFAGIDADTDYNQPKSSAIWRTQDGGSTWSAIGSGLPARVVHSIVQHPRAPAFLYVGTDKGIFTSEDGGTTWNTTSDAPARVAVHKLFWGSDATLYAATLGRGMFRATVEVPQPRLLAVTKAGTANGQVISRNLSGIVCGSTCSAEYMVGTSVTLKATPLPGAVFAGWSGACSGTSLCVVGLSQSSAVTATFNLQGSHPMTVSKAGTGSGPVVSTPAGIACGSSCSAPFMAGSTVRLVATPNTGSLFTGWSGACTGASSTCFVTMNAAQEATATFGRAMFPITIDRAGTGSGLVTSQPAGISCGSACTASFDAATTVTLTATPAAGSVFAGWIGCRSSGPTCTVSMTEAQNVTAAFVRLHALGVTKAGTGSGPVSSSPAGITCGSTCSATFAAGTPVQLTATANSGSMFTGWSGACSGATTCTVPMDAAKSVTASFQVIRVLTVSRGGAGTGTISSAPAGILCGSACSAAYAHGTTVTLSAVADTLSTFAGWTGACSGASASCVVSMTEARNVMAIFTSVFGSAR
jgi:photosystem II stability/assembly factor-like uncharacterized protein